MIKGRGNDRMKEKKRKKKRVIPGFGLSFGITIAMLGFIVVIPLCTLVIFSAKLSFTEFITTVTRPRVLSSYRVSLETALIAALIDAVMGTILACVAGIALTHLTTTNGWLGAFFGKFGIRIAYTRLGIIFALIFVGIPFVVRAVQPVLEKVDIQYEEAANMLGATNRQTVFRVILPEILPALIGGFTMSFARGLGEYGSVVFIAGNTPYETEIAPLMIMSKLQEYDYASATSIALVMLFIAFIILFINAVLQSRTSKIVSGIS